MGVIDMWTSLARMTLSTNWLAAYVVDTILCRLQFIVKCKKLAKFSPVWGYY